MKRPLAMFLLATASFVLLAPSASAEPADCLALAWDPSPLATRVADRWSSWSVAFALWFTDFVFGPPMPDPGAPPVERTLLDVATGVPPGSSLVDPAVCALASAGELVPPVPDVVGAVGSVVCPALPGCA